uniref:Uncharacterized protein n=1 Tax=Solanum lycopersicum TaxID=4081 RepID=A0A3Q7E911_SOLLC
MPNFFVDVCQDLVYAYGWPSRLVRPIWKVKRAVKRAYPSFQRFRVLLHTIFWVIRVKRAPKRAYPSFRRFSCAIAHHFLGDPDSDVKNAKFFRGRPSRPCLCIRLAITACPTHLEAHHFLGDPDFDVKNAKFFRGRPSRPCLCTRLAIMACPTHLERQTSPEASIPLFRRFSCAIAHHFLDYPDSDVKNAKFFVDVRQDFVYAYG